MPEQRLRPGEPVLAVIGPSGSGKSTVIRRLVAASVLELTPSWTTRPRRAEEAAYPEDAVEHRFVSEMEFDSLERRGFFLESDRLFGLPFRYGLPHITHAHAEMVPAVMLRAPLIPRMRVHHPQVTVYQIEDSEARAVERLRLRHPDGTDHGSRLAGYRAELAAGRACATRVFVNDGAVDDIVRTVARAIAVDFASAAGGALA